MLDKEADLAGPGIGDYNELEKILPERKKRQSIEAGYLEMEALLGSESGSAQAAQIIKDYLVEAE